MERVGDTLLRGTAGASLQSRLAVAWAARTSTPDLSSHSAEVSSIAPDQDNRAIAYVETHTPSFGNPLEGTFTKGSQNSPRKSVRIKEPEIEEDDVCDKPNTSKDIKFLSAIAPVMMNEHDSLCRSSEVESPASSCAYARAQYYHTKLLSTLELLRNKEETVKVQSESLAMAEARIATLTERSADLKREIERRRQEMNRLREKLTQGKSQKKSADISITANDVENQKIVEVLQNNLSVIEDLYRECFYETAKQESLIEMLRKSYLDVRLMDKEKSDQISRLNNVINTQKWSLDKFQDIASDVDNLKVEISNFLNNSSNDSGVWEESLAGDVAEDLQDIAGELIRLRELLVGGCTCGLDEENRRLRLRNSRLEKVTEQLQSLKDLIPGVSVLEYEKPTQHNDRPSDVSGLLLHKLKEIIPGVGKSKVDLNEETQTLKIHSEVYFEELLQRLRETIAGYRGLELENRRLQEIKSGLEESTDQIHQSVADLEDKLENKEALCKELQVIIINKEDEIKALKEQLSEASDKLDACEKVKIKLQQAQDLLAAKSTELEECRARFEQQNSTICDLKVKVEHSGDISKEYCALRRALAHYAQMDDCHRAELACLEASLAAAQARGAGLCAAARRAVRAVRRRVRRRRAHMQEQEEIIKQKDSQIKLLRAKLERSEADTEERKHIVEIDNRRTQCEELHSATVSSSCDRDTQQPSRSEQPTTRSFAASKVRVGSTPASSPNDAQVHMRGFPAEIKVQLPTSEASVQEPVRCDATANSSDVKPSYSEIKMEQPSCSYKQLDPCSCPRKTADQYSRTHKMEQPSCSKHKIVPQSCKKYTANEPSCNINRTAVSFGSPKGKLLGNFPIYPPAAKLFLEGLLYDKLKCEASMQNPIRCDASVSSTALEPSCSKHNAQSLNSNGAGGVANSRQKEQSLFKTFLNENKFYTDHPDTVTCFSGPEDIPANLTYHRTRGKSACKAVASEMRNSTPRSACPRKTLVSPQILLANIGINKEPEVYEMAGCSDGSQTCCRTRNSSSKHEGHGVGPHEATRRSNTKKDAGICRTGVQSPDPVSSAPEELPSSARRFSTFSLGSSDSVTGAFPFSPARDCETLRDRIPGDNSRGWSRRQRGAGAGAGAEAGARAELARCHRRHRHHRAPTAD